MQYTTERELRTHKVAIRGFFKVIVTRLLFLTPQRVKMHDRHEQHDWLRGNISPSADVLRLRWVALSTPERVDYLTRMTTSVLQPQHRTLLGVAEGATNT